MSKPMSKPMSSTPLLGPLETRPWPRVMSGLYKLVAASLPDNAPHWPPFAEVAYNTLCRYKDNARSWKRMGEAIGRPRFFRVTGRAFRYYPVGDWRLVSPRLTAS